MITRHLEQSMLKQPEKKEQNTGHLLIQAEQTGYGLQWLSTEMTGQVDSKTKANVQLDSVKKMLTMQQKWLKK